MEEYAITLLYLLPGLITQNLCHQSTAMLLPTAVGFHLENCCSKLRDRNLGPKPRLPRRSSRLYKYVHSQSWPILRWENTACSATSRLNPATLLCGRVLFICLYSACPGSTR